MKKQTKTKRNEKEKKIDNTDLALLQLLLFCGIMNKLLTEDKSAKLKN